MTPETGETVRVCPDAYRDLRCSLELGHGGVHYDEARGLHFTPEEWHAPAEDPQLKLFGED